MKIALGCGFSGWLGLPQSPVFRIPKPFVIEFITRSKSGVSGVILAVVPGKLGIGVFSPGLDAYGNSVRGIKVCEEISERLGLHIFADDAEDALLSPLDSRKRS